MAKTGKIYYVDVEFTDAQVAAQFTFPCMFFLRNAAGKIIKHITYDLNGEKSIAYFGDGNQDNFTQHGPITTTSNSVTIGLSPLGENFAMIDGVKYIEPTTNPATPKLYTPVSPGKLKELIIHALPDAEVFHLVEGIEGNEAVRPDYTGLFVASIIVNDSGEIVTENNEASYKTKSDDTVYPIIINVETGIWVYGRYNTFEVLSNSIAITPILFGLISDGGSATVWNGKRFYIKNSSGKNLTLKKEPTPPIVGDTVYFSFSKNITLKDGETAVLFLNSSNELEFFKFVGGSASFPETGNNGDILEKDSAVDGGVKWSNRLTNVETNKQDKSMFSALVDKWIHMWDAGTQKMQPILKFVSGVVNQLEFTGRIKADAIVLPNNTNPVVANRLRSDGNRLKYSDEFPIERDIAYLSDITGSRLIKQYVHTGNREIYPSAVDYATSRITATGHGFSHGGVKLVGLFLNGMAANYNGATPIGTEYQSWDLVNTIPFEWLTAETWIKVIDANTLEVCNSSGVAIAVNPSSAQNNGRLNFTKWHIEEFVPFSFSDIPPDYKNVEIRISGMMINRNYASSGNRYISIASYLPDYSITYSFSQIGHGIYYLVFPKIGGTNNINSVFFSTNVRIRTSNHRFVHYEITEANRNWGGSLGNEQSQQIIRMNTGGETRGIAGLKSITSAFGNDSTWLSNYSIIEIYAI